VFMSSRAWARLGWPLQPLLAALERRWAHRVDRVITVNEPYADLLAARLGIDRPAVVMNSPEGWSPPVPPPDLIREALGLASATRVVLYAGQLVSDRGIEQAMDAVLQVPEAVLVLLGYGPVAAELGTLAGAAPYAGRVRLLPAVPPDELLPWTASADVTVMAIQPTSLNHRFTTPQKLLESLAAGVPVVASDLPGMRAVIEASRAGVVCDPTSPDAIAAAIREILDAPAAGRADLGAAALAAAHGTYSWERQTEVLFGVYRELTRA
jgi:glycosyltransferase involved in cell wall biosynthesis